MRVNKKYLKELICWFAIVAGATATYLLTNSEGLRFILFATCLLYASEKFDRWISEEDEEE